MPRFLCLFLFLAACAPAPSNEEACNGLARLCDRRVDEVVFAGTHNAHATEEDGIGVPNQYLGVEAQLRDGVRAFMLDTYAEGSDVLLCHGACAFGAVSLIEWLQELRRFLERHPNEVVLLLFEDYVTGLQTKAAFDRAEVTRFAYTHERGTPWPTLRELIASGTRIIVFAQDNGGEPDWYHSLFAESWDTPYAAKTPDDLGCEHGRGDRDAPLFVLNHFLTAPFASVELARSVNFNPFLIERAHRCEAETGRLPNVIAVDYYEEGDLLDAVRTLNMR